MITLLKQHKLMALGGVALVAVFIWYGMTSSGSSSPTITTTPVAGSVDPTLVSTLLTVSAVNLDGTIFTEPAFTSLQDYSTPIIDEPVGRPNPFAPLSPTSASNGSVNDTRIFAPTGTPN